MHFFDSIRADDRGAWAALVLVVLNSTFNVPAINVSDAMLAVAGGGWLPLTRPVIWENVLQARIHFIRRGSLWVHIHSTAAVKTRSLPLSTVAVAVAVVSAAATAVGCLSPERRRSRIVVTFRNLHTQMVYGLVCAERT